MSFTTEEKELRKLGVIYKNEKGEKFINRQFFSVAFFGHIFISGKICMCHEESPEKATRILNFTSNDN